MIRRDLLSFGWLLVKLALFLALALEAKDIVDVAYQRF